MLFIDTFVTFQIWQVYNLVWSLLIHSSFDDLDLFQGHRCVRNIKCRLSFLYSCTDLFEHFNIAAYFEKIIGNCFVQLMCISITVFFPVIYLNVSHLSFALFVQSHSHRI